MYLLRCALDECYNLFLPILFRLNPEPETAHNLLVKISKFLAKYKLDKPILSNSSYDFESYLELSNAAGFNKNGLIPPSFLESLGLDRIVIGTVTGMPYDGNPKPRVWRGDDFIYNKMGLPNLGSVFISKTLASYKSSVPLTVSIAPTPYSSNFYDDLVKCAKRFTPILGVDRFELNVSCPNSESYSFTKGINAINEARSSRHKLYLKIPPTTKNLENIVLASVDLGVDGFVVSNSLKGVSGNPVYASSLKTQKKLINLIDEQDVIACGGINSLTKIKERIDCGAKGFQFYSSIIFDGPKFLSQVRRFLRKLRE